MGRGQPREPRGGRGRKRTVASGDDDEFDHTYASLFDGPAPPLPPAGARDYYAFTRDVTTTTGLFPITPATSGTSADCSVGVDEARLAVVPVELAAHVGRDVAARDRQQKTVPGGGRGGISTGADESCKQRLTVKQLLENQRDLENIGLATDGQRVRGAIPSKARRSFDVDSNGAIVMEDQALNPCDPGEARGRSTVAQKKRPTTEERRERKLRLLLGKAQNQFELKDETQTSSTTACRSRTMSRRRSPIGLGARSRRYNVLVLENVR